MDNSEIVLLESAKLNQDPDAGGNMTGKVVAFGEVNNLFPKKSSTDTVAGRVHLIKVFSAVLTSDQQSLQGAHMIVAVPPEDGNTALTIFSTGNDADKRRDARDFLQSYLAAGPVMALNLYDTQLAGQRNLRCWAAQDAPLPAVGAALAISHEPDGDVLRTEFVRIVSIDDSSRQFQDGSASFSARIITVGISQPLQHRYDGTLPSRVQVRPSTVIRDTEVADAAEYFGTVRLKTDIVAGDSQATADTIFGALVPSAESEESLVAIRATDDVLIPVPIADEVRTITALSANGDIYLGQAFVPGSLVMQTNRFNGDITESGGQLSSASDTSVSGTSDPQNGHIHIDGLSNYAVTVTYMPAVFLVAAGETALTVINENNRGYNYVQPMDPPPQPGTVSVIYRSLDRWYTLRDTGSGQLEGDDPAYGAGIVDFQQRIASATLGREPDVGSAIIWRWGIAADYERISSQTSVVSETPQISVSIADDAPDGLEPGSVVVKYIDTGNNERTLDDTDQRSILAGHGDGRIDYENATALFMPAYGIKENTLVEITGSKYTGPAQSVQKAANEWVSGQEIDLGTGNILAGSVSTIARFKRFKSGFSSSTEVHVWDDGNGVLNVKSGPGGRSPVGTVDYAAGTVTLTGHEVARYYTRPVIPQSTGAGLTNPRVSYERYKSVGTQTFDNEQALNIKFRTGTNPVDAVSGTAAPGPIDFQLAPLVDGLLQPNSVAFALGDLEYYDRDGSLYHSLDDDTGAGIPAGTIDYGTRLISIEDYNGVRDTKSLTLHTGLLAFNAPVASTIYGRTAGAPLKPGQFFVRATTVDGVTITAEADAEGAIVGVGANGEQLQGAVDFQNGLYAIYGHDGQGTTPAPLRLLPSTVDYSTVVTTFLPLDPELLGLDPIRLPQDGRVPLFRSGRLVVVHHTLSETLPGNIAPGDTYSLQRDKVALIELFDADDNRVLLEDYSTNGPDGEITIDAGADLSQYPAPLRVTHRREDMLMASDVRLDGLISFVGSLTFDYPAGETLISSALRFGDLQATVTNLFAQIVWQNEWLDEREGDQPTAQYNAIDFPVEVRNDGAVNDRWALIFSGTTTFDIVSEKRGVVGSGNVNGDASPQNPATGAPYFTLRSGGWGSGGQTPGYVLRFNTESANAPVWMARTILAGAVEVENDQFVIENRGNAD